MTVPRLLTVALLATLVIAPPPSPAQSAGPVPSGMAEIEGGEFEMGMPFKALIKKWKGNDRLLEVLAIETPAHKVEVAGFYMDKYEVTNAQYLVFMDDAHKTAVTVGGSLNTLAKIAVDLHGTEADEEWWQAIYHLNWKTINPDLAEVVDKDPKFPGGIPERSWATKELKEGLQLVVYGLPMPKHWLDHGTIPPGLKDHPVRFMSWDHANKFARWAGKHLPKEKEWERAARGPKNSVYPWGGSWRKFDWKRKEDRLNWALLPPNHEAREKDPSILTCRVGQFDDGKSGYGIHDMLGNVWEWTDAVFGKYPEATLPNGKPMPDQDWWQEARVVRGGAYNSTGMLLRSTFRTGGDGRDLIFRPKDSVESFGFRCARWPAPGADRAYQAWREMADAKMLPDDDHKIIGFTLDQGIGVEATRYDIREDHVYVVGRSRTIAVLPRGKLPVSLIRDLNERAEKSRDSLGVVVGVVTTDLDLQVFNPEKDGEEVESVAAADDYVLSYHDGRLQLLKGDIMGLARVGYLVSKKTTELEETPPVVELGKLKMNSCWTVTGLDQAHVKFAVNRRARGAKERFVFHAVFKTAEKSVLNVDWMIWK